MSLPAVSLRPYLTMVAAYSFGFGLYSTANIVFLTKIVGLDSAVVSVGLGVGALSGLLVAVPVGRLSDRIGHRRVLLILRLAQALLFACYPFISGSTMFLTVAIVLGAVLAAGMPVTRAVLSEFVVPDERVKAQAKSRTMFNVGVSLGSAAGGLGIAVGTRTAFVVLLLSGALASVLAAYLVTRLPRSGHGAPVVRAGAIQPSALRAPGFLAITAISGVLALNAAIATVALPLLVVETEKVPDWTVAVFTLLNTILVIVFQVPAARGAEDVRGAARASRLGGLSVVACCAFLMAFHNGLSLPVAFGLLFGALLTITAAELFCSAGSWGVSHALAPDERQGDYFATFGLGFGAAQVVGPPLMALVVEAGRPGWIGLATVFLIAALAYPAVARFAERLTRIGSSQPALHGTPR
ncbi:MFS transporter [Streptomyces antioxidans]|uniref:MFS transporter n=1 Tax=Streptomyces antioxidans TaxID=1507734 RepID=A0A1V4D897_9ACTN|nr:MFS transporter [Streptomyces antioxidans]OPF81398.1 MFS transporter [Streptomyces antioxidans]